MKKRNRAFKCGVTDYGEGISRKTQSESYRVLVGDYDATQTISVLVNDYFDRVYRINTFNRRLSLECTTNELMLHFFLSRSPIVSMRQYWASYTESTQHNPKCVEWLSIIAN